MRRFLKDTLFYFVSGIWDRTPGAIFQVKNFSPGFVCFYSKAVLGARGFDYSYGITSGDCNWYDHTAGWVSHKFSIIPSRLSWS